MMAARLADRYTSRPPRAGRRNPFLEFRNAGVFEGCDAPGTGGTHFQ